MVLLPSRLFSDLETLMSARQALSSKTIVAWKTPSNCICVLFYAQARAAVGFSSGDPRASHMSMLIIVRAEVVSTCSLVGSLSILTVRYFPSSQLSTWESRCAIALHLFP
uniref:Uncharacterized protein K02A2.6 n=1 Tax=Schistocephalus solidus TaxID=70667 RepID=A0A0X3P4G2_SCHSO